jgi:hypothetical protein
MPDDFANLDAVDRDGHRRCSLVISTSDWVAASDSKTQTEVPLLADSAIQ